MSYCRVGADSDVYVIAHVDGGMACYCGRDDADRLMTKPEMLRHLAAHRERGDTVPQRAMDRLIEEIHEEKKADMASTFGMRFGAVDPPNGMDPDEPTEEEWAEQKRQWEAHVAVCLAKNVCPHSGLEGPECKSWLCDCFQFEDLWGVSQK